MYLSADFMDVGRVMDGGTLATVRNSPKAQDTCIPHPGSHCFSPTFVSFSIIETRLITNFFTLQGKEKFF